MSGFNAVPLSIKSVTMDPVAIQFDAVLANTIRSMVSKRADAGEVSLKLKISLVEEESPEDEDDTIIRPSFEYKVNSVIVHKDSVDGKVTGNYELVGVDDGFGLREFTYGQASIFDRPPQEGDGFMATVDESGNVVGVQFAAGDQVGTGEEEEYSDD